MKKTIFLSSILIAIVLSVGCQPIDELSVGNEPQNLRNSILENGQNNIENASVNINIYQSDNYNESLDAEQDTVEEVVSFVTINGEEYSTSLTFLALGGLELTDEDISVLRHMVNLTWLDLSCNQISDITPLTYLVNLEWLNLEGNLLSDARLLSNLVKLETLILNKNQITDINQFVDFENLMKVYLRGNPIDNWSPLNTFVTIGEVMINKSSERVTLNDMNLTDADIKSLQYMTSLRFLDLGIGFGFDSHESPNRNQISDISPIREIYTLEELYLSVNEISDISPLSGLTNLVVLALNSNQIYDISSLSALTNLEYLALDRNYITDIAPLSSLSGLRRLDLLDNLITDITPLTNLVGLEQVSLNENPITDWSPVEHIENVWGRP